jgi:hypothetical protein
LINDNEYELLWKEVKHRTLFKMVL